MKNGYEIEKIKKFQNSLEKFVEGGKIYTLTHKYMTVHFPGLIPLTHKYMTVHFPGLIPLTHKYNTQIHDCSLSLA